MRKAINRMTVVLIGLAIILLATSIVVASGQSLVYEDKTIAYAEDPTVIIINETNVGSLAPSFAGGDGSSGNPYLIATAGEFVKAMKEGNSHYRLEYDVLLTSTTNLLWAPVGNFSGNFNGNNKTITYAATSSGLGANHGLFLANSGIIRNVNYVFTGLFSRNGGSNYGSFVGVNDTMGIVDNCTFTMSGMINVRGNNDNQVLIAGGVIGRNRGKLSFSTIEFYGDVSTSSYVNASHDQINNVTYSGGVVGYNEGYIEDCDISVIGSVTATNNHERDTFLGFSTGDRSGALYTAGGVIGYTNGGTILRCTIESKGNNAALGIDTTYGASGGIVGVSTGSFSIQKSTLDIGAVMQVFSAYEDATNLFSGGIVGRLLSSDGSFRDNVVQINLTTDNLVTSQKKGCLLGGGNFNTWNKGNVWLVYDFRSNIGLYVGDGTAGNSFNRMDVRGSGSVNGSVNASTGAITLYAIPNYSPLYGWMSNASANARIAGTYPSGANGKVDIDGSGEFYPQIATTGASFEALFLKTELNQAGDLNVLADLNAAQANWAWISVKLINNITATGQYTPIGDITYPFNGTFDGNGYNITFTSTTLIKGVDSAGLFGVNQGTIKNINIAFGGEIRCKNEDPAVGLFGTATPRSTNLYVGMLAGVNYGTITDITLLTTSGSQIRGYQTTAGQISAVGGLVGLNAGSGKIANAHITIQGKVHAGFTVAGALPYAGGLIGYSGNTGGGYIQNISVAIEGEVAAFDKDLTGTTMRSGGLIGYIEEATYFVAVNVSVAIKKTGIFGNPGVGGQGNGTNHVGAISSILYASSSLTIDNVWVILDKSEEPINGMKMYGNDTDSTVSRGENRLYIAGGIVQADINNTTGQISMNVPIGAGEIFAGWFLYDDFTGMLKTTAEGVYGNTFRPNMDLTSVRRYTKVITSIIYNDAQFADVAHFTNQGNTFEGESFILGANIAINDSHVPIGNSVLNKFQGTFNGGGLTVTLSDIKRTNIAGQASVAGLFGYLGVNGHVYNFNIIVNGTISQSQTDSMYSAVLVAYNEGTIGLDSPSQKTKITMASGSLVQGLNAGGIVAYNLGLIYNIELTINGGVIEAGNTSSTSTRAGGAVAYNNGIVKNIYIICNEDAYIRANGNTNVVAGGAVGLNNGHLHSIVVVIRINVTIWGTDFSGGVIGNNTFNQTSNLWMVVDDAEAYPPYKAEGTNIYVSTFAGANLLQISGPGAIEINVEANPIGDTSGLGGMIVFKSVTTPLSGTRTFYGYMYDLETGELLNNTVGVSDYIFTPYSTLKNKEVYSVFALSKINTFDDLVQVSNDVNNGINPRIIYNLLNNITITGAFTPIGTTTNQFHGIFKGNQKTISIGAGAPTLTGLFGTIAEQGRVEFLNVTLNRAAVALNGVNVGAIASTNNGTISNVSVELNQKVLATNAAGGVAGINNGVITAATVNLKYVVISGVIYEGSITGANAAGGISGINNGDIGCSTVQDIKVLFDNGAKISTTANNASAGGVTGVNNSDALIMSAFLTINGIISSVGTGTSAGGIAGKNAGFIHTIFVLIEGQGVLSGATAIGLVSGTNSGVIGLSTGNYNNINVGIYKNMTGEIIGAVVGKQTAGDIHKTYVTINGNISGANSAGGLIGEATGGTVNDIELTLANNNFINGVRYAGGLIGNNFASVNNVKLTINGTIKCEINGVLSLNSDAGGAIGENNGPLVNVLITLRKDVIATRKGSVAGKSAVSLGSNVWVLLSNSIYTDVSSSSNTGYNSIKIVGDASFKSTFDSSYRITFEVMTSTTSFYNWYSDISNGVVLTADVNTYDTTSVTPDRSLVNRKYHISFYDLDIGSGNEFKEIANYINHHNYFNNVRFRLSVNINITGSVVPIGTEQYPFNGIFDGNGKTIKFVTDSSIGAVAYSGLFGYTSENSMLYNFVLDIQEGVIIGGQSPVYSGALVGYSLGNVKDVLVRLGSTPRASAVDRIGGVAGYFNPAKSAENTWLILHNASCKASSNSYYNQVTGTHVNYGINTMNIIGSGDLDIEMGAASHLFTMKVPTRFETTFRGWYGNISEQILLESMSGVGAVNSSTSAGVLYYSPLLGLTNRSFSISFIRLNIYNYADLKNFSSNINTYSGFNGVQFILHNNILINDDSFIPIGTKNNPFSGIFEGNGYSISFAGKSIYGSYPGLFGYINSTGSIKNLVVVSNTTTTPNTFGDNNAIYTGLVASYSDGLFQNVIAQVKNNTTIFCVNKAGGMVGAIGPNFQAINAWVVLNEKSTILASGIPEAQINIMYTAGNGSIRLQILGGQVTFTATPDETTDPFYGYIDGTTTVNSNYILTPADTLFGARYTAIFLNSTIRNYADLVKLSETINSGLNYSGVIYSLNGDITIDNGFTPIGGLIGSQIIKFRGIFNGNGHTITIPYGVTITGAYAGLFGYIDTTGGVMNLRMVVDGTVGNSLSIYSGSIAGYNEGDMENLALYMGKAANHIGTTGVSGYVGLSTTIANNAWVLNYNSKSVMDRNLLGRSNGLNSFTILGAGLMNIDFVNADSNNYNIVITALDATNLKEWFYYEGLVKTQLQSSNLTSFTADPLNRDNIYYVSFLNTDLVEYSDILKLAEDVNEGYDFYGITFTLLNDITLEAGYPGIGGSSGAFSGNFIGGSYTITLPSNVTIVGLYSGIFGRINRYGTISNLKIKLNGTLGNQNTKYAGAFAYNSGRIDNCVVEGYTAILNVIPNDINTYAGTVIGYDVNSFVFNTWGVIASYNNIAASGVNSTGVNKLKVVGVGRIYSEILPDGSIRFTNDTDYNAEIDITGWYRNYASSAVISNYLGIGTVTDSDQTYLPATTVLNAEYEVIIIKVLIENETDLNVLANDINIGGYDFKNVTFIVVANFTISNTSVLIGKEESPFRGILDGNDMTINILGNKGIFGYNAGTIKNLKVIVSGNISSVSDAGAIAYVNNGKIESCNVTVNNGASISGITTGAMVGVNNGTISKLSTVVIMPSAILQGETVGGAIGISNGSTADIEVQMNGNIEGVLTNGDTVYAGGAIGYVRDGVTRRIVSTVTSTANITANGSTAYAGGLVGRNRSVLSDSVLFGTYGTVISNGDTSAAGEFAGISNSNMANSWMVMRSYTGVIKAVGDGPQSINHLTIYGNGGIKLMIDRNHGNLLFYMDDTFSTSTIDGWYTSQDVAVSEFPVLGNVSSSGEDYAPSPSIMGRKISVVFINTLIYTVDDLIDLADAVNGGMSSRYIEFILQNDIDINEALPNSIGTPLNGFNFLFNGQDYKINIFSNSYGASSSLFGYIGSAGVVVNLNIYIYGTVGDANTIYAGGLAAENEGEIRNSSVTIAGQGIVIGNTSGGAVGRNYSNGSIRGIEVNIIGRVESTGAVETNRAGGMVGRNDGLIESFDIHTVLTIQSTGIVTAYGLMTSYAGGIAGQNTGIIRNARIISNNGNITAAGTGPYNSFVGGISATNTGTLSLIIVNAEQLNITASGTKINYAGNITGSNKNKIDRVIVYAGDGSRVSGNHKDTAVGLDDSGVVSLINNTWIIGEALSAKSLVPALNNMFTIEQDAVLILEEDLFNVGTIVFKIVRIQGYFPVYDNISDPNTPSVYLTDIENEVFTPSNTAKGYVASVRNSNTIASGTELIAFAKAVNTDSDEYLTTAVISMVQDIELSGDYPSIGTMDIKFTGTFNGNSKRITALEDAVFTGQEGGGDTYASIFGFNNGTINDLITDYRGTVQADRVAGIAIQNFGTINNSVVYLVDGELIGNSARSTTVILNTGTINNIWTITNNTTLSANYGKIIYVRGQGYIETEIFGEIIEFVAVARENNILAGWTYEDSFISNQATRLNTSMLGDNYSVEFVSLLIGSQLDLANISRLMPRGFITDGIAFNQINDIVLSGDYTPVGTVASPFNGGYNGNGYVITINNITVNGTSAGIFGSIGSDAIVENIIIELEGMNTPMATSIAALTGISSGTINNIVVYVFADVNHNILIGTDNGSTVSNLWVITSDDSDITGVTAGIIVVIGEGNIISTISTENNTITMTADTEGTNAIFAGWYHEEVLSNDLSMLMDNDTIAEYTLVFITSLISTEQQYIDLADAVKVGFDLDGYTISLVNDITLNSAVVIGNATNVFKGVFNGDKYTINVLANYTESYAGLFAVNEGVITNLIVKFSGNIGDLATEYAGAIAGINNGAIENVVAITSGVFSGVNVGGLTSETTNGDIINSWFVSEENTAASNIALKGNKLTVVDCDIDAAFVLEEIVFTATAVTSGKFVVWYSNVDYSEVLTEGVELNQYTATAILNGESYAVREIDTINILGELLVFASNVNDGDNFNTYEIKLGNDIVITECVYVPIGIDMANSFAGTFDGKGYSITIAEDMTIDGDYAGLFGVNEGIIIDLIVYLYGDINEGTQDQGTVAGLNDGILINIAVYIYGNVYADSAVAGRSSLGELNNCWYIIRSDVAAEWLYLEPAYSITIMGNGEVVASYNEGALIFTATVTEGVYFAGWTQGVVLDNTVILDTSIASNDYLAEFIDLYISEEIDLISLARVINTYGFDTTGITFEIMNDINTSADFVSLGNSTTGFGGTINGNFNVINLNEVDEVSFDGFIAYCADATINALAFTRDTAFATYADDVVVNNILIGCSLITNNVVLVTPIAAMTAGGDSEIIIVGTTGDLTNGSYDIVYDETAEAFKVIALPNTVTNFDLRGFYDASNVRLLNDTNYYIVPVNEGNVITIKFALRYYVTFNLAGIPSGEAPVNTPELSGAGHYWFGEEEVILEVVSIGNGYLFRGIRLAGTLDYLSSTFTYIFPAPSEHKNYVAQFELISFAYLSMVYNADRQDQEVNNTNIEGLSITYMYEGIDLTKYDPNSESPIDVGRYKVTASIYKELVLIGIRTVGYQITPAPLSMIVLNILDKDYDTNANAVINGTYTSIIFTGIQTSGIRTDLITDISLINISFAFSSANAGTWNIIVTNNTLASSADASNPDCFNNYWFGTELNQVVMIGASPVVATIHPLVVSVMATTNISKTYGEPDPVLTHVFLDGSNVPFDGDNFTGALSREAGENVGVYKINRGTLNLSPNYLLTVYATGAELTIIRRVVIISIITATKQYGAVDPVFSYSDESTLPLTGIVGNDRLVLQWDYPRNALPSATPYSVEALFNPISNPNYDIVSNLQRSVNGITCKYIVQNAFIVIKREVYVTVTGNNTKVYGTPDLAIKISFTNNLIGDNLYPTRQAGENTGNYAISYSVINANGNVTDRYNIIPVNGTGYYYTITPKIINIVPAQVVKTYGEDGEELIPWNASLPEGVEVTGNLARQPGSTVGEYPIELGTLTISDSNYELRVSGSGQFIITTRVLTVTISNETTKIYGHSDPVNVPFDVTGYAIGDDNTSVVMTSLNRINTGEAVGSYSVSADFSLVGATSINYQLNVVPGEITVIPREITIATNNISMVYGAVNPAVNVSLVSGELVGEDSLSSLGLSYQDFKTLSVGTYDVVPVSHSNANYSVTTNPGTLTVTKRKITVTVESASKIAGEEDPEFTYSISGKLIKKNDLKGALSREEGEKAGTYKITEGTLSLNKNYTLEIVLDEAYLTIERAPVSFVPIAIAGGAGALFLGAGFAIFTILRKLKTARIPI